MTPTLSVIPSIVIPGDNIRIEGSGFDPSKKVQLTLDNAGATTNYFRPTKDGTFHVGMTVSTTAKTQILAARYANTTTIVASAAVTVAVPVPVPPPVPPPTPTRPFPLPITTREVTVLSSGIIQAAIDSQEDGTLIKFTPGTYTISTAINLKGRNNLILDFQGSTIINTKLPVDLGTSYVGSTFWWSWADVKPSHITIKNLIVKAANPKPGVLNVAEHAAVLHAMGGSFIELDNITGSGLIGDLLTCNENPSDIWVHNSHVTDCGRNNVSIICGQRITIEDNTFDRAGYCGFDIEPETSSIAGVSNIIFRRNTLGTWVNSFFSMDGVDADKAISDITIADNKCTGGTLLTVAGGSTGKARPARVAFTGNTGVNSSTAKFNHVDGLTFKLNTNVTLAVIDCTGVITT
jgi:hypothetical protein